MLRAFIAQRLHAPVKAVMLWAVDNEGHPPDCHVQLAALQHPIWCVGNAADCSTRS